MLSGLQETIPACVGICDHIASHTKDWKVWATSDSPHDNPLPSPWNDCINSFNTMCVLKIFRQEKLVFATEKYVMEKLGKSFTESPPVVLADIFPDTSARCVHICMCVICMTIVHCGNVSNGEPCVHVYTHPCSASVIFFLFAGIFAGTVAQEH